MQFKLKEEEIIDFLELNFPEEQFEKGRLLVGQNKQNELHIFYLGESFKACVFTSFNTFEHRLAESITEGAIQRITLKDGLLYRKMFIEFVADNFKYGTSKLLLSDFQNDNYNAFIKGEKERVIFENGNFI
ncbi:hypothetical protein [Staphylococcus caeli]|uniref:hypothetical protein n=1 Tax=Staphylococcus caeli TaxID=2201815 RepID=UPI003F56BB75